MKKVTIYIKNEKWKELLKRMDEGELKVAINEYIESLIDGNIVVF